MDATIENLKLENPPIIEAVVDIDCDMPPNFALADVEERSRAAFRGSYPQFRSQFIQEHQLEARVNEPPTVHAREALQSLQFYNADQRQLIQVRTNGFSFNRLRPYTSLDDYVSEIHRCWSSFVDVAKPLRVRRIALRYINRILLPMKGTRVDLDQYIKVGPRLPDEDRLTFLSFLNQYAAAEPATGNVVKILLTTQTVEASYLPVIFDIEAMRVLGIDPGEWNIILEALAMLRSLKNDVFRRTLTPECLRLFQRSD